ncbi:MAG: aminotransferase class V-fold PLP-dependent enzyme, partial [Deltaproteobacteria bacterium]|nr:aminotransferase class V-fold PLP-dependent enzyme [Deltaproteobacteria bacterium]
HKLYGPKGVGVLFIKQKRELTPLIHGAGQEFGRRAGTESTILATGLGMACRIARGRVQEDARKTKAMRDKLQTLLFDALDDIVVNGHPERRLPNTLNISIPGIEGKKILDGLPRLMCSTGAACHDRSVKLSYVLSAMSIPPEVGMGALRLSVGRSNTMAQVEEAAAMIINRVKEIRESNQSRT